MLGLGGVHQTAIPGGVIDAELGGTLQKGAFAGQAAATAGTLGRALELGRNLLIRPGRGPGTVPGPTVGVELWVDGCGQSRVHPAAILRESTLVDGRAHERVTERDPRLEHEQPVELGHVRGRRPDLELFGRTPQKRRVAELLGCRQQQQRLGLAGQPPHPRQEPLFQRTADRERLAQRRPARQFVVGELATEFDQRQRVPSRLRNDPLADPPVQPSRCDGGQEFLRRFLGQPLDAHLGEPLERRRTPELVANGEHHPDPVREQPTPDEPEHPGRGPIDPLCVIDHAKHRPLGSGVSEKCQ